MTAFEGRRIVDSRFAGDDGAADPRLRRALESERDAEVLAALRGARLLVPVMAVLLEAADDGTEKAAEMATPVLPAPGGGTAMPAFTGVDALALWRPDARPVPVLAPEAAVAALEQGCAELVLDVAGPSRYVLAGSRLRALAAGEPWLPVAEDTAVHEALARVLGTGLDVAGWQVTAAAAPDADATLLLDVREGADLRRIGERLAADEVLRERLERGLDVRVTVVAG